MTKTGKPYKLGNRFFKSTAFVLLLFLFSCALQKKMDSTNYHQLTPPANSVKIENNLYCEQTEITNFAWMEYVYWIGRVYGSNSIQFKTAFPDTNVWIQKDYCLASLSEYYLRHPVYKDYPVVGISQQQAIDYSNWRSDRVFEWLLIKNGVLEYNPDQNAEMHFTIERYFDGQYNGIEPDTNFRYFPRFRLPSLTEWKRILTFSDSINNERLNKCRTKKCRECKLNYPDLQIGIEPCTAGIFEVAPARNVYTVCFKNEIFPNLRGNVSEWTAEQNICVGGSWVDETVNIQESDTVRLSETNAWTGFRNVCEWKKIE